MDRLACVNVASLPLQILLRIHPEWAHFPVAVVEAERPQALVLHVNASARKAGIRSGQRYAAALTLTSDLRAGTISSAQIEESVRSLADCLRRYSPSVELASDMPGVFWLDAQGLEGLYPSLHAWAEAIHIELRNASMIAAVAVGFSRFGVYALAMFGQGVVVCRDAAEERAQVEQIPLDRLNLDPDARDRLLKLGIVTVGDFLRLPAAGIRTRFGAALEVWHEFAAGRQWVPLLPVPAEELHERSVHFDAPESNAERLVFVIKQLLDGLVMAVVSQAQAILSVTLQMRLDDRTTKVEHVRSAAPTLDIAQLLSLIYLRLNTLELSAGIVTLRVTLRTCAGNADQRGLFPERRRDVHAANQALARVRAECGDEAVVRAHICNAHLPAACFGWKPLAELPTRPAPRIMASRPLVRRIFMRPFPLPRNVLETSPEIFGPYVLSGGWWAGGAHRDYYFVPTKSGHLWWLYYDHRKQCYFLQGQVE